MDRGLLPSIEVPMGNLHIGRGGVSRSHLGEVNISHKDNGDSDLAMLGEGST